MCLTFVVFTDCENCTRPIFTNPGSMEVGECGLTRGTCFAAPSRVGRGRRASVNFVVCFGWGEFFFCAFHEFAFSKSFVDPVSEQPAWTRRRGSDGQPFSQRELAHTYPHQVYRLVCSHLRNLALAVDQYSSSRPTSLIFDPTSECNLIKFFSSFESASRIPSRERKLRQTYARGTSRHVF